MNNSQPVEEDVKLLGGKVHVLQRTQNNVPDVVVADHAAATRLQV